jgi:hypothetical protein
MEVKLKITFNVREKRNLGSVKISNEKTGFASHSLGSLGTADLLDSNYDSFRTRLFHRTIALDNIDYRKV